MANDNYNRTERLIISLELGNHLDERLLKAKAICELAADCEDRVTFAKEIEHGLWAARDLMAESIELLDRAEWPSCLDK